jgi:hypothetical protein
MNSCALIAKCADAWEALSARNYASRQYVNRKVMTMKMDPKADPVALEHLEMLKSDFGELKSVCFFGFCRVSFNQSNS